MRSYRGEGLQRDPCECQADLGDIARMQGAEVSFVSSSKFVMYWAASYCRICVNIKLNLAILQR